MLLCHYVEITVLQVYMVLFYFQTISLLPFLYNLAYLLPEIRICKLVLVLRLHVTCQTTEGLWK
jgi:hypothetical protein